MGCCGTEVWSRIVYSSETDGVPAFGRSNRAAGTCAEAAPNDGRACDVGGRVMSSWEYLIVSLPEFEPARAAQGESSAVMLLNHEGGNGWEAVGITPLRDGSFAVLLKRPVIGQRDV